MIDYRALGTCHPKLARNRVWCVSCGSTIPFNSSDGLRHGWPICCGQTMTIDSPWERHLSSEARRRQSEAKPSTGNLPPDELTPTNLPSKSNGEGE